MADTRWQIIRTTLEKVTEDHPSIRQHAIDLLDDLQRDCEDVTPAPEA